MYQYRAKTPRAALAAVAIAMSALTLGLTVIAPAALTPSGDDPLQTVVRGSAPAFTEVTIIPARIDVHGVRAPDLARSEGGADGQECKGQS